MSENKFYEENIKQLREKTEQEMLQLEFKKRFLGGINQKDVISYVNSIREQAQRAEETFKERINELARTRDAMRSEQKNIKDQLDIALKKTVNCENTIKQLEEEKQSQQQQMDDRVNEILDENTQLTKTIEEMASNLKAIEDKMLELQNNNQEDKKSEEVTLRMIENEAKIVELTRLLYDQRKQCIEQELQTKRDDVRISKIVNEKTEMENTIASLKEDVSRNYSQLEEQIKSNHKLVFQLESERLRVAKAEKYIAEVEEKIYIVNDINNKYKEQSLKLHEEIKEKYDEVEENFTNQVNDIMNNFKAFKIQMFERNVKLKGITSKTEEDIGNLMETVEQNYKKDNIIDLPKYKQGS